jgi:chemotaxis protein MotB
MIRILHPSIFILPIAALLSACVVSQSTYDAEVAKNEQLQQQMSTLQTQLNAAQAQATRLQGAIKYTVDSDLLFPPGGWEMSAKGKDIIAKFAAKLAPTQEHPLLVNGYTDNAPIGKALAKQGITSNEILSQKRAENVMQFLISQGVKPELVSAHGYGDADSIDSNSTREGRAKNRRVELTLAASGS